MSATPIKTKRDVSHDADYRTQKKQSELTRRPKSASLKSIENLTNSEESSAAEVDEQPRSTRRSVRKPSPTKKYKAYKEGVTRTAGIVVNYVECTNSEQEQSENTEDNEELIVVGAAKPNARDIELIQSDYNVAGTSMFGFNTPKKRDAMSLAALNATPCTPKTPKTPKTPRLGLKTPDTKRKTADQPKTPSRVRTRVKQRKS